MMSSWDDALNAWEQQIVAAEQALATNNWSAITNEPFVIPENLGKPTPQLINRYEALSQRTAAIEHRITERGGEILSQLETMVVSRGAANRFEQKPVPAIINKRV